MTKTDKSLVSETYKNSKKRDLSLKHLLNVFSFIVLKFRTAFNVLFKRVVIFSC